MNFVYMLLRCAGKTVIGLSYPYLCQDVKEGGRILMADGAVSAAKKSRIV
jgi:pyruvate kinase